MITEVTMYRVVCDAEGCFRSAQDDTEHYAWTQPQHALDDCGYADWYVGDADGKHLCFVHAPVCANEDCGTTLPDDEWGAFCQDHAPADRGDSHA